MTQAQPPMDLSEDSPSATTYSLQAFNFQALADLGVEAVCGLWDAANATFLQSSSDVSHHLRPTVTFRCADVLFDAAQNRPELVLRHADVLEAVAERVAQTEPEEAEDASTLAYKPFTAALHTLATARVAASTASAAEDAAARLPRVVEHLRQALPPEQLSAIHPFVEEHALRAALMSRRVLGTQADLDEYIAHLRESVARAVDGLLARHHAGLITPAESVVLVFCAAALSTTAVPHDDRLALVALAAAATAQDGSGSWPLGRVVRDEPSRLEISTYEVAWAVTETLRKLLGRVTGGKDPAELAVVLNSVARASSFAEQSVVELTDGRRGWSSDHPYEEPRIESWTSAIAAQFALAADDLRDQVRNRHVLSSFAAISPRDATWPTWLRWTELSKKSEPDEKDAIYDYLERRVIQRIERHSRKLPSGADETASVLLFGPPGTSKTTLVQAVADRLGWPVVFLSPGIFIEQGLEAIEAAAQSVFARLHALRQVVVLFDECDELFRDRRPSKSTEQVRNISAFVTASMLPKLQDLHDRGKVLFFICTNHAGMMDPAVLRGGRMDHRIGVGPPDERARREIIAGFRDELPEMKHLDSALSDLAGLTERFSRGELKRAALRLTAEGPWANKAEATGAVPAVVQNMHEALIITEDLMSEFREEEQRMSDPYREKA